MGEFCDTPLWDSNLTWYTENPKFTSCFEETVLVYIPVFILLLFIPAEIQGFRYSSARNIPWGPRIISRLILIGFLLLLVFSEFLLSVITGDKITDLAGKVSPVISLLGLITSFTLVFLSRRFGKITSMLQFFYWLSYCICQALRVTSSALDGSRAPGLLPLLELTTGILIFIFNLFADPAPAYTQLGSETENPSPSNSASFASLVLKSWFDPFVVSGWSKPLVQEDLWSLDPEYTYSGIMHKWEDATSQQTKKEVSVLGPLFKCFGVPLLIGALYQLVYIGLVFVNPQILNLVIQFVEEGQEMWKGYLYVVVLGITSFLSGIFDSSYWNSMRLQSMRVQTALSAAVYKKALVLSATGRKDYTSGEIVNLIAVDCSKVQESVMFITFMFTTPLQIVLAVYFLWSYLNYSILIGIAAVVLLMPLNIFAWSVMEKYQKIQMEQKDIRVNLVNEILNAIKVLKLYAWEKSFIDQISEIRLKEVSALRTFQYIEGTQYLMWNTAPVLLALVSFAAFVLVDPVNNILDAQTAFVSLTLFNTLREPLFMLPFGIVNIIQGMVSIKRINKYLNAEEIDPETVAHEEQKNPIVCKDATLTWDLTAEKNTLTNLTFSIKEGSLVAVVGSVGTGKSSLLSGILGEMYKVHGTINTFGTIAYVSQQAWIRNATVQNNILFNKPYSKKLYEKVIENCALETDLAMLTNGDLTEIGEKGINLSGGQKQRINLARAVYSNRDIYLFDDPLSAVDAHVGKHLFEKVIGPQGMLQNKTRVLVTHGIGFLPQVDVILVMKDGKISEMGSYESLIDKRGDFSDFMRDQMQKQEDLNNESDTEHSRIIEKKPANEFKRTMSSMSSETEYTGIVSKRRSDEGAANLIEDEYVETESVDIGIYSYYFKSAGLIYGLLSVLAYLLFHGSLIGANFWLAIWADDESSTYDASVRNKYLIVYAVLGATQSIFVFLAVISLTIASINASIKLHDEMLKNVLRSPMAFFDTTPLGRIVNRFSKDIDEVDIMLPMHVKDVIYQFLAVMGVILVISIIQPIIITAIVPLVLIFLLVQSFYLKTSRQLKRLMSINRSPINSHLDETLSGAATIRAFGFQDNFEKENEDYIDRKQMSQYPEIISNTWLFLRLQVIGNLLIILAALTTVINRDTVDSGLAGLVLTYALTCQIDIYMLVRFTADLEKSIVSVERIKEYQETPQEAATETNFDPDFNWPSQGMIKFESYSARYRPGLDLVISDISCEIKSMEKIGIVGRTGAGKSSVTLSLFRIIEAANGGITIDGIDISQLGLTKLRSGLTIIPQDPVLFSGTLRFNLDPFNKHSDRELWRALELSKLSPTVKTLEGGLNHKIAEGGINLSVGQRQLLCLVRALLRKTKILVLDEATAAIDLETDDLIQKTIREEFNDCTVLTIAHRIQTIMDSDRVMVMDKGQIKEFKSPSQLLKDKSSIFFSLAQEAGLVN